MKGFIPVEEGIEDDWDNDDVDEAMLDIVSPGWDLVWDQQEYGGVDLEITRIGDAEFLVESLGQAMLRITRPGGKGRRQDCGLVDARFEFVATSIEE